MEKYPDDAQLIANTVVLNVLSGKNTGELISYEHLLFLVSREKR